LLISATLLIFSILLMLTSWILFITFFIYSPSASFRLFLKILHSSELGSNIHIQHTAHRFPLYFDLFS
jgi:hypothetical protein